MNERDTDFHGLLSVFIRVNPCPIFEGAIMSGLTHHHE